jgi:hypothetical protein
MSLPRSPSRPLGFREPTDETPATYLFIATTNRVLVYQASGRGSGGAASEVHEAGAALGCAVMDWKARYGRCSGRSYLYLRRGEPWFFVCI